jgi:hypothetical protein
MSDWTIQAVAERFREAANTAQRLPSAHVAGYARFWPETGRRYAEESWALLPAAPAAIDRFIETTTWLRWLNEDQRHLVWARAMHRPWRVICERGHCNRNTAWRRWQHALSLIVVQLNQAPPRIVRPRHRSVS